MIQLGLLRFICVYNLNTFGFCSYLKDICPITTEHIIIHMKNNWNYFLEKVTQDIFSYKDSALIVTFKSQKCYWSATYKV